MVEAGLASFFAHDVLAYNGERRLKPEACGLSAVLPKRAFHVILFQSLSGFSGELNFHENLYLFHSS
jgi:hypothetical protein